MQSVEPVLENAIKTLQKVVDVRGMGKKSLIYLGDDAAAAAEAKKAAEAAKADIAETAEKKEKPAPPSKEENEYEMDGETLKRKYWEQGKVIIKANEERLNNTFWTAKQRLQPVNIIHEWTKLILEII